MDYPNFTTSMTHNIAYSFCLNYKTWKHVTPLVISPLRGEPNKTTINFHTCKFRAPKIGIATRLENHLKLLGKVKKGKKYMSLREFLFLFQKNWKKCPKSDIPPPIGNVRFGRVYYHIAVDHGLYDRHIHVGVPSGKRSPGIENSGNINSGP
ncbi:hypothetical protein PFLG_02352 [Plasmodium falciparum RAJ116]|uniref:Uncharacterized protein n=1 Tax=Plasmodium falciparum RAJ116 TaxID=580058 RepID=A0A0L0CXQ7_PLAFA|nr:hypothetical protein PFLG_02352 [Plasmodium falciparum RAJ116]